MAYKSPIELLFDPEPTIKVLQDEQEKMVVQGCINAGVRVDRDQLIAALEYDRNQYDEGYEDGYRAGCKHTRAKILNYITNWEEP